MNICSGSHEIYILVTHSLAVLSRAGVHPQVLLLDLPDGEVVLGICLVYGDPLISLN